MWGIDEQADTPEEFVERVLVEVVLKGESKSDTPVRYELRAGTEVLWSCELPVKLLEWSWIGGDAVAGYSQPHRRDAEFGTHLFLLGSKGELLADRVVDQEVVGFHGELTPEVVGVFGALERDRVVFRIRDRGARSSGERSSLEREDWRVFRYSDGKELESVDPSLSFPASFGTRRRLAQVRSLTGVPLDLALVHQARWVTDETIENSHEFCLIDEAGQVVWTMSRPARLTSDWRRQPEPPRTGFWRDHAIRIRDVGANEFTVVDALDMEFSLTVSGEPGNWNVHRVE